MKTTTRLIILDSYSILTIENGDGSRTELKLNNTQMRYIEQKIEAHKSFKALERALSSETAQESIDAGREVSRLLGY